MAKKKVLNFTILHDSTMVEHLTLNLKIKGSSPTSEFEREKVGEYFFIVDARRRKK